MRPILSVIIVTYYSEQEISDCLLSIPQTLQERNVEVIVVDNRSPDGTTSLITKSFPSVRLIALDENIGFSKANNIGYENSIGEYVLFLNPDTISNSEAYAHCLRRIQEDQSIGLISPKLITASQQMDLACRRSIPTIWCGFCRAVGLAAKFPTSRLFASYNLTYLPENGTYDVGAINGAFMLCSRSSLIRFGAFDEQYFMYGDDLDLCYRCAKAGYRVVYDGQVQMIHLKGMSSSKEASRMSKALFSATLQFYLKHFNPRNSLLVRLKYKLLVRAWELLARAKRRTAGYQGVRPL